MADAGSGPAGIARSGAAVSAQEISGGASALPQTADVLVRVSQESVAQIAQQERRLLVWTRGGDPDKLTTQQEFEVRNDIRRAWRHINAIAYSLSNTNPIRLEADDLLHAIADACNGYAGAWTHPSDIETGAASKELCDDYGDAWTALVAVGVIAGCFQGSAPRPTLDTPDNVQYALFYVVDTAFTRFCADEDETQEGAAA